MKIKTMLLLSVLSMATTAIGQNVQDSLSRPGDVNGDGQLNETDVEELVGYIMGQAVGSAVFNIADVNSDGKLNAADVVRLITMVRDYSTPDGTPIGSGSIVIERQPDCALVNITGISSMPTSKGTDAHAWMEVWDNRGTYFKKKVLIDLQGNSTTFLEKKNFGVDFCEDDWVGDKTTDIKIGDWVTQDSYHFKAYHTSITKGEAPVAFKLYRKFMETKPETRRAPFMDYYTEDEIRQIQGDESHEDHEVFTARCFPDGFPCVVFLNGKYYGLFSWQLKKHRDNYYLSRNKTDNIHLDGMLGAAEFWDGNIAWTGIEVRNPKPKKTKWTLMCQDGTAYDKENPKELMGEDSPSYNKSDVNCVNTAQTKSMIISLSKYMGEIASYESVYQNSSSKKKAERLATLKEEIEKRFSMEYMIDYVILQNFIENHDACRKNWQWTTWGEIGGTVRWYANPYDLDHAFGIDTSEGSMLYEPSEKTYGIESNTPARYVWNYYLDEMKARYAELRQKGVLTYETVWGLMKDWVDRVGAENYAKESSRWPEMPCNRDKGVSPNWELTGVVRRSYEGNPSNWDATVRYTADTYVKYNYRLYRSLQDKNKGHDPSEAGSAWWEDVCVKPGHYKKGSLVFDGRSNFFQFRALASVNVSEDATSSRPDHLVETPFVKFYTSYPYENGTQDSVERIEQWIKDKIVSMDKQMGYDGK